MRSLSFILAAVSLALPALAGSDAAPRLIRRSEGNGPAKYIVKVKDGMSKADVQSQMGPMMQSVGNNLDFINAFTAELDQAGVDKLMASGKVDVVEEDGIVRTFDVLPADSNSSSYSPSITQANASWALGRITNEGPWTVASECSQNYTFKYGSKAGSGVDVYVIDTGIRITHEQFEGRAKWGATFGEYKDVDGNGHGTHVAGSIASRDFGVAKKANLIAVKVLSDRGTGNISDVIEGMNFVLQSALNSSRPSIASMSLGGPNSTMIDLAVTALARSGVHVVVAAGNSGSDASGESPAGSKDAISIGATTNEDEVPEFSNFGPNVALFAPGLNILSTWKYSDNAVKILSGTSMACPHVSGMVASLISDRGNRDPRDMKALLQSMALKDVLTSFPPNSSNLLAHLA